MEKKLDEAYNPKLTELQKSNAIMNPYFKSEAKIVAPDHLIIVVI